MTKLYRVRSRANYFPHNERVYDAVELCWFVVYRDAPSFSCEQIIEKYGKELDNLHYISENNLNELFTEEEAKALEGYLLRVHKQKCNVEEADLLLESYSLGYEDIVLEYEEGFHKLNEEEGYNLPFVVWSYYDVSYAKDVSWLIRGAEFIEKALYKMGMSLINKDKIKSIVEELKSEGLFVDKGAEEKHIAKNKILYEDELPVAETQVKQVRYK